jgi:hypothetical protein
MQMLNKGENRSRLHSENNKARLERDSAAKKIEKILTVSRAFLLHALIAACVCVLSQDKFSISSPNIDDDDDEREISRARA